MVISVPKDVIATVFSQGAVPFFVWTIHTTSFPCDFQVIWINKASAACWPASRTEAHYLPAYVDKDRISTSSFCLSLLNTSWSVCKVSTLLARRSGTQPNDKVQPWPVCHFLFLFFRPPDLQSLDGHGSQWIPLWTASETRRSSRQTEWQVCRSVFLWSSGDFIAPPIGRLYDQVV